jgi:hypothetical protein
MSSRKQNQDQNQTGYPPPEDMDSPTIVQPLRILKSDTASPPRPDSGIGPLQDAFPKPGVGRASTSSWHSPNQMFTHDPATVNNQRTSTSTEGSRISATPKHLSSLSSEPDTPDEGLFKVKLQRPTAAPSEPVPGKLPRYNTSDATESHEAQIRAQRSNRIAAPQARPAVLSHTMSTSTTRGQRGSPPPPETPAFDVGDGPGSIEARYAASGISGTETLSGMSAAAAMRLASAGQSSRKSKEIASPWTPTESPDSHPFGPATIFKGGREQQTPPETKTSASPYKKIPVRLGDRPQLAIKTNAAPGAPSGLPPAATAAKAAATTAAAAAATAPPIQSIPEASQSEPSLPTHPAMKGPNKLETDMGELTLADDLPPSYDSVAPQGAPSQLQDEKNRPVGDGKPQAGLAQRQPTVSSHPAFAQENRTSRFASQRVPSLKIPAEQFASTAGYETYQGGITKPPPLPEGWMAHLDPNSGQYYYIHMGTQSTQWEFPKGPNPLNMNQEPMSPSGLKNPGFPMSPMGPASPTVGSFGGGFGNIVSPVNGSFPTNIFTGAPTSTTVFNTQPSNGVYFGPYLKYTNMDVERGVWIGSILLISDQPQPPTIHIHQTIDLSPNPHQLKANPIHSHQKWTFYKYEIELQMDDIGPAKWTYAITSHLGCTRFEFLVAGRYEHNWRFIAHSGNDFGIAVPQAERLKLGGEDLLWRDVLHKHNEIGGFHCQLGLGNQVSNDRIWKDLPLLKEWLEIRGKENRKNAIWTIRHEEDTLHAYFHYYTSHFDQPHIREAFAQIPHVLTLDDQDIFDGYGSFPDNMQESNIFKNTGRIAYEWYLLFQHHMTLEMARSPTTDKDLFTVTGTGWHFIKYLGPSVVVVGPDTRSERTTMQVMAGPTYQGLFPKIAALPPSVQHCLWMVPVPLLYPRMETVESIANVAQTGKKAVTGAYNILGKVAGNVAGVVGAKGVVVDGFQSVKGLVGKKGLMGNIITPFGDVDFLDDLRDMWTHESKVCYTLHLT